MHHYQRLRSAESAVALLIGRLELEPPLIAHVVSRGDDSFSLPKASKECVINIPTVDIGEAVARCGNSTGEKIDKFGLTPKPAPTVTAPLVDECYTNLERRVVDACMVPQYGLFVVEVVQAWIAQQSNTRSPFIASDTAASGCRRNNQASVEDEVAGGLVFAEVRSTASGGRVQLLTYARQVPISPRK